MVNIILLRGLCGYIWVNILTLSPPRVTAHFGKEKFRKGCLWIKFCFFGIAELYLLQLTKQVHVGVPLILERQSPKAHMIEVLEPFKV